MFDGFDSRDIDHAGVRLRVRTGGDGPPLLLLHGHPQTHAMWHRVAPALAERFCVVAMDLRGRGDSSRRARCSMRCTPSSEEHHEQTSHRRDRR